MIFLFLQIASVFMHLDDPREPFISVRNTLVELPPPDVLTHLDRVAAYYIMAATFYAIIW